MILPTCVQALSLVSLHNEQYSENDIQSKNAVELTSSFSASIHFGSSKEIKASRTDCMIERCAHIACKYNTLQYHRSWQNPRTWRHRRYFKQKNKTNGEQSSQVPLYYWCVHFATESDKKHLKSMWHIQLGLLLVGTAALIAWSTWLEG